MITYTFCRLTDGSTYTLPYERIWQALDRAEYDVETQAGVAEPMTIKVDDTVFEKPQILALLETWVNPSIIKREHDSVHA
jgi:hypothetical protein